MSTWKAARYCCILMLVCPLASAQDEQAEDTAEEEPDASVCVNTRNIDGFDALTDEHIFISARRNENYLFTMRRRCTGLRSARGIAVKDTMNRVCSNGFGEVVYRDLGRRLESCMIDTIERVEARTLRRS